MQMQLRASARVGCPRPAGHVASLRPGCPAFGARKAMVARADKKNDGTVSDDDCAYNLAADYCVIDEKGRKVPKRSLGEMEQDFLNALSSFYYEGKPAMSDEEFGLLKEELIWSGSTVAVLSSDEQKFLEATMAYTRGTPIMADEDYDLLKADLRNKSSIVTAQGPRCSIRSKKMYADSEPDYLRMVALNLPGVMAVLGVTFALDYATGFGVTNLIELPAPYGVVLLWGLLLPSLFVVAYTLTQVGFRDNLILKAACPSCGAEVFSYFGNVFTIAGARGQNVVECQSCKADLTFDEYKRIVVVAETSEVKQEKLAAAASKKAAAAAKKKVKVAA
ncbi:PGR5-like protein 1B, chloroplastic [Tetrabaena socialis]|uniref:PGR5-like protein 1B, chloroplastic n=1 Tax=Tetrabaena socialis TaxID=47790 RepID=A0A2J8A8J9_9CHLO|nr:PGR5-like protein 1B, chloroplastic [Tetrabaena socialis]|eukprot:PNH08831.1 PGR5-like protein 1B, chloroplastic [Tetrabaena socialis]